MTSELNLYRTASVLIREHGDEADLVAAMRADSFREVGDMAGSAVWKRVLRAIKEIQRQEPHEGDPVNWPELHTVSYVWFPGHSGLAEAPHRTSESSQHRASKSSSPCYERHIVSERDYRR